MPKKTHSLFFPVCSNSDSYISNDERKVDSSFKSLNDNESDTSSSYSKEQKETKTDSIPDKETKGSKYKYYSSVYFNFNTASKSETVTPEMKKIKERLECPVCFENIIEDFKILPCNHQFCLSCIKKLEEENANGKIKCPLCRKEHDVIIHNVNICRSNNFQTENLPINILAFSQPRMTTSSNQLEIRRKITERLLKCVPCILFLLIFVGCILVFALITAKVIHNPIYQN